MNCSQNYKLYISYMNSNLCASYCFCLNVKQLRKLSRTNLLKYNLPWLLLAVRLYLPVSVSIWTSFITFNLSRAEKQRIQGGHSSVHFPSSSRINHFNLAWPRRENISTVAKNVVIFTTLTNSLSHVLTGTWHIPLHFSLTSVYQCRLQQAKVLRWSFHLLNTCRL